MDRLEHYREIIQQILAEYARVPAAYGDTQSIVVADAARDHYLWMDVGWDGTKRVDVVLIHLDIIDGKIWIQYDGTEHGVARDLVTAGIPKDQIVLAFHPPNVRQYTEYAVV